MIVKHSDLPVFYQYLPVIFFYLLVMHTEHPATQVSGAYGQWTNKCPIYTDKIYDESTPSHHHEEAMQ